MSLLKGHGLWAEGKSIESRKSHYDVREGRGECECGELSPALPSKSKRKQWHRDHKADIAAGGNGRVWQGDTNSAPNPPAVER